MCLCIDLDALHIRVWAAYDVNRSHLSQSFHICGYPMQTNVIILSKLCSQYFELILCAFISILALCPYILFNIYIVKHATWGRDYSLNVTVLFLFLFEVKGLVLPFSAAEIRISENYPGNKQR